MFELAIIVGLLFVGYGSGSYFEKRHYRELSFREEKLSYIPVISGEWRDHIKPDQEATIFGGGVVVASDYFKTFVNNLRGIFGGRMSSYESLLDRGRREAILRMLEKAEKWGAEKMINVRVETSTVSAQHGKGGLPCIELYAYGTAVKNSNPSS